MTRPEAGSSSSRGPGQGSPLDSCWLVVAGTRYGPMPFEMAVERLHAFHREGIALSELNVVEARHLRGTAREGVREDEPGAELTGHAHHGARRR